MLQGKYNKEVGDLRADVESMKAMVERQNKIIEDNNSRKTEAPKQMETSSDLDPEDYKGWGDEMTAMVKKMNKMSAIIRDQSEIIGGLKDIKPGQQASTEDSGLMDRINSLEQKSQEDRVASYLKQLDTGINGDWRKLNVDPNFHAWLSETDPMTMSVRGNLLNAAAENFRGDQVVSIFNQYLSGSNVTAQSTVTIADELPGGGSQGQQVTHGNGKATMTPDDVHAAQQDFIKGKITEEEYDKVYSDFQKELRRQQNS